MTGVASLGARDPADGATLIPADEDSPLIAAAGIARRPPPRWIVEGLIEERSLTVLYGEPGVGKSFVALDLCDAITRGRPFLGCEVRSGGAVYIAGEGAGGLPPRLRALELAGDLDSRFLIRDIPVDLGNSGSVNGLIQSIRELDWERGPELVVLDTLAMCMPGMDEDSARDMGSAVQSMRRIARETGAAVLAVHHPTKRSATTERGSGALKGAADAMLLLKGPRLVLESVKQKNGPSLPSVHLTLELAGDSMAVRSDGESVPGSGRTVESKRPSAMRAAILAALAKFESGASSSEWQRESSCPDSTFYREVAGLLVAGLVENPEKPEGGKAPRGSRYHLTDAGRCHIESLS